MNKSLVYGAIIIILLPLFFFIWKFYSFDISNSPNEWSIFAAYVSGTTGTVSSIVAGYFLYKTILLQNTQLEMQNIERIENMFFTVLYRFTEKNESIAKKLINDEQSALHQNIFSQIIGRKNSSQPEYTNEEIQELYVSRLGQIFIADYSRSTKTLRLHVDLNKYFQGINSICELLMNSNLPEENIDRLRRLFLSQLHDSEIKMICYYNYLLSDIVNSTDLNFTARNIVKDSKLFEGDLLFSDDFSRNLNPRKNDFEFGVNNLKKKIKSFREADMQKVSE